ncbi:MAG: FtsQ-type POTRA domain-containing protein [Vallitaleaceae bacterium]|nr:FtsQ-type POTRA domain-containing protein [Vallitaleaceae bacterium]
MSNVIELRNKRKKRNTNLSARYLLLIAFILVIILFFVSKIFQIKDYEVVGNHLYSSQEIFEILKIDQHSNIIKLYMNSNGNFEAYPYISSFDLEYQGTNKVKIEVHEKQIIGYILYMSKYLCVDKDGYIVDTVDEAHLDDQIAVIEGFESDALVMGEKVNIPQEMIDTCLMFHGAERSDDLQIKVLSFPERNLSNLSMVIGHTTIFFGDVHYFSQKIQIIKDILSQIPPGEYGTLYLGVDGSNSFYEKNVE